MHRAIKRAGLVPAGLAVLAILGASGFARVRAQTSPMQFANYTTASGIGYSGPSWSIAWGDANGDALPDLFIGNHGYPHNLFLNRGNGRFGEIESWRFERPDGDAHGAAWADFDNDGDQDLLEILGADGSTDAKANRLYVNEKDGVLRDRGVALGLGDSQGRGRRPVWFDWDSDGLPDVLVLNALRPDAPSKLFKNVSGYFEDSHALGSVGFTKYPLLGSFASGATHLVVSGQPFPNGVYDANQVSPLPLRDVRAALGIPLQADHVMDAALFDVNGDGRDDFLQMTGVLPSDATIVVGRLLSHVQIEDAGGTRGFNCKATGAIEVMIAPRGTVWWNPTNVYIGSRGLHPVGIPFQLSPDDPDAQGLVAPQARKGVYVGYDRSIGKWKMRVIASTYQEANFEVKGTSIGALETVGFSRFVASSQPTLLASSSEGFRDVSSYAGLTGAATKSNCFSVVAADFDNDRDLDVLAACSGPLARQGVSNQLFRNDGFGRFKLVPGAAGVGRVEAGVADGLAASDFDLDGFVDVALTNGQGLWPFGVGPTQVFRNASGQAGNRNHWLEVDLQGVQSNRDGIGAQLILTADGRQQRRMQRNGVHNGAQDHVRIHFGLGSSTAVQSLEIRWPSGVRQIEHDVPVDQVVRIVEGRPWAMPYSLEPFGQSYGNVRVASSLTRSFTFTNLRDQSLAIARIRSVGVDAGLFVVAHACGAAITARASCAINVTFRPTRTGPTSARLMLVAGDRVVRLAGLYGTGS